MQTNAVLLLAYGGPNALDDIPAYLREVRGGQPTPPPLLEEITRRYRLIGGRSPLGDITRRVAARLQEAIGLPVYVGMRHWHPYIKETVQQMSREGIHHAVVICMAPHYSTLSIGAYRTQLDEALQGVALTADFVESWHTQPHYIEGITSNVRETLARFSSAAPPHVKVIFTAHSLPASIREQNDPYETQLRETARLVAQQLNLPDDRWMLGYQSAPRANGPWLGPQIGELVPQLAQAGERHLLVAPIGFVADHVEVLHDLDIALREIARANNIQLERTPMLNDSPALVAALADLAHKRIGVPV